MPDKPAPSWKASPFFTCRASRPNALKMERKDRYSIDENNFLSREEAFMPLCLSLSPVSIRSVRLEPKIVFDRFDPEAIMNVVMYADRSKKSGSRTGPHLVVAIETSLQIRIRAENIPIIEVVVTINEE
eukprot:54018_1